MISRRTTLLQQLGITTYQLCRPERLKGESAVHMASATKLILVVASEDAIPDEFLKDILQAMCFEPSQLMIIQQERLKMLPHPLPCRLWLAGVAKEDAVTPKAFTSPALITLQHSVAAKRNLWQQITAAYE